jgi:hypothetical protein
MLAGIFLLMGVAKCSEAHDWHLWDTQELTSVRMMYCDGYMLAETEEFGIILIEKIGDLNHSRLHIQRVDEYECVYETEPLILEED